MFIFLIDTDLYSGNFERELTAYCTGHVGQCGVGSEYSDDDLAEKFENIVYMDDDECERPCASYTTPGYFNDGMGRAYKDEVNLDLEEVLENKKKNITEYLEKQRPDYIRWDIEEGKGKHTNENRLNKEIKAIQKLTIEALIKYPSYQSVAIFFGENPTKEQIEIIKERSQEFFAAKLNITSRNKDEYPTTNIIGYRLIEEKTVKTVVELEI